MNKLYQTVKYCKQFESIPRYDRYEKGCKNCPHTDLCDILPCMPAEMDLLKLGVLCRKNKTSGVEGEFKAELEEDYRSLVDLVKQMEKDSQKLADIKDLFYNFKKVSKNNTNLIEFYVMVGEVVE